MYKVIEGTRGKRYMHNGKLVKTSDVPEDIIEQLKDRATVEEEHEKVNKSCIFCGMHGNFPRLVNNRTIYLCSQDYYDRTIGQCAQKLNQGEKQDVEKGEE